jgi:hypothetical protein
MPRRANVPALTGQQASYILGKLIDERKVSAADVRRHLAGMWQEMNFLEKRLSELRGMVGSMHPVRRAKKAIKRVAARVKRVAKTPEAAASRKLQGQYIAYIRQIPTRGRKRFADMAKKDGREAAITAMKKQLGK